MYVLKMSGHLQPCRLTLPQVRKQRQEEEAVRKQRHDAEYAEKLNEQIREDVQRQQLERERFQQARKRAMSDATEVPWSEDATPTESFDFEIKWQGQSFRQVRLFHPRQGADTAIWYSSDCFLPFRQSALERSTKRTPSATSR